MTDQTPPSQPVPVTERLPEPNTKVLAHYFNDLGKGRTICAIWVPAKSRSDESGGDDFTEYDEEDDKFYWPEGWYEVIENWDELGWVQVYEGEVDYWQPLPKWPAALAEPDGPAVSDDREPASVTDQITAQLHRRATILLIRKVIDQALRDTASVHWRVESTGEQLVRASDLVRWAEHMEKQMEQLDD